MEKNAADVPDGISFSWEQLVPAWMEAASVGEAQRLALVVPGVWLGIVRLEKCTVQRVQAMLGQVSERLSRELQTMAEARLRALEKEEKDLLDKASVFLLPKDAKSRQQEQDWFSKNWTPIHDGRGNSTHNPDEWWWKTISDNLNVRRTEP